MPVVDINIPGEAKNQFMPIIKKGKVLCLYYWKHCGFCITFHPIWDKVTKYYKDRINAVSIELDCLKELGQKYSHINGFPTVKLYEDGKEVKQFTDKRTEENLHDFIRVEILNNDIASKKHSRAKTAAAAGGSLKPPARKTTKSTKR